MGSSKDPEEINLQSLWVQRSKVQGLKQGKGLGSKDQGKTRQEIQRSRITS